MVWPAAQVGPLPGLLQLIAHPGFGAGCALASPGLAASILPLFLGVLRHCEIGGEQMAKHPCRGQQDE